MKPPILDLLVPALPDGLLNVAPFAGEEAYWALVTAQFVARARLLAIEDALRISVFQGGQGGPRPGRQADALRRTRLALQEAAARASRALSARLSLTEPAAGAPRITQFVHRAGLGEHELAILHYMVLCGCDPEFCELRGRQTDINEVGAFFGMGTAPLFAVMDERAPLRSLGLVSIESRLEPSLLRSTLQMDLPVVRALRGLPMTVEQRFAVPHGPLRSVLDEREDEETQGQYETSCARPQGHSDDPAADDDDRDPGPFDSDRSEFNLESFLRDVEPTKPMTSDEAGPAGEAGPYRTDIEYLEGHLDWIKVRYQWKKIALEDASSRAGTQDLLSAESRMRDLQGRERALRSLATERTEATRRAGDWEPRAERLARLRGLDDFEKHVLLLLAGMAGALEFRQAIGSHGHASVDVGELLMLFFDDTTEHVRRRRHFYRDAPLVRDGLVSLDEYVLGRDLLGMEVRLDPRMSEYLLGIEAEDSCLVEGSHLFRPTVSLDRVVLPEASKTLVVQTVERYSRFLEARKRSGLDELVPSGSGIVLLFHGPSGTGKTMLANALAARAGKRILLVNFPTIGSMSSDDTLRFLFREARINDAVLFFDECEGIFQSREHNPGLSLILTEIERHDGLVIMATNRAVELDEAMRRRITLSVPFPLPDAQQRERIWRAHIPAALRLSAQPDYSGLAYRYELSGGLIKNAVVSALAFASSRNGGDPVVSPEDLETGAKLQVRNRFGPDLHDEATPKRGLSSLVVPASVQAALEQMVGFEKTRRTLVNEWGFGPHMERGTGMTALFHGPPGTGKSLAAEAVAFELGRPLRRINAARVVSMWVGEGAKRIEELFTEARSSDAVLVFDEADSLFATRTGVTTSTDRYANLEVAILLREMERFPGVAILTTNCVENLDVAFRRRLRFVLEFPAPNPPAREALWRMHIPAEAPIAPDVDLPRLAAEHELTGAQIRNVVIKAAALAAMRPETERVIRQLDLSDAARAELVRNDHPRTVGF